MATIPIGHVIAGTVDVSRSGSSEPASICQNPGASAVMAIEDGVVTPSSVSSVAQQLASSCSVASDISTHQSSLQQAAANCLVAPVSLTSISPASSHVSASALPRLSHGDTKNNQQIIQTDHLHQPADLLSSTQPLQAEPLPVAIGDSSSANVFLSSASASLPAANLDFNCSATASSSATYQVASDPIVAVPVSNVPENTSKDLSDQLLATADDLQSLQASQYDHSASVPLSSVPLVSPVDACSEGRIVDGFGICLWSLIYFQIFAPAVAHRRRSHL